MDEPTIITKLRNLLNDKENIGGFKINQKSIELILEAYDSKPLPSVGVNWPSKITYYYSKKGYPDNCVEAANKMREAFMSEIAKLPLSCGAIDETTLVDETLKKLGLRHSELSVMERDKIWAMANVMSRLPSCGKEDLDYEKIYESLKTGHRKYMKAGMSGEMNLLTFMTDEIISRFARKRVTEEDIEEIISHLCSIEIQSGQFNIPLDHGIKHPVKMGDVVVNKKDLSKAIVAHIEESK